jgi:asparagine synthase (glutamine-hydrolysing)
MAGIAGISKPDEQERVSRMLEVISYRGNQQKHIFQADGVTLGILTSGRKNEINRDYCQQKRIADEAGNGHLAEAIVDDGKIELKRDQLGVAPLYYDSDPDGTLFFASEVKALSAVNRKALEFPPGCRMENNRIKSWYTLEKQSHLPDDPELLAQELRMRLDLAIRERINGNSCGAWLSGGLDSSTIAALAKTGIEPFHTFVTGLPGAGDLEYAREVARHIGSRHHEIILDKSDLAALLPQVIWHLESFDALLVRSSIMNFMVARAASEWVKEVFSGEAGDEFFAGYHYLKSMHAHEIEDELISLSKSLHNTALQRVDRCASAHGITAHIIFADPRVFEFALQIPLRYKLHHGIEKWIIRRAMDGLLPARVLNRSKVKFWEGAGVGDILAEHADQKISDHDFRNEKIPA